MFQLITRWTTFLGALVFIFVGLTRAQEPSTNGDANSPSLIPTINAEAQKVIDHVKRLRDKPFDHADWKPEKGPWADYLADTYTEQLDKNEKIRFEKTLFEENCRPILSLQSKGFLRKYPFLKAAHKQTDVESAFRLTVGKNLPDYKFCSVSHQLKQIIRFIEANGLDLLPVDYSNIRRDDWTPPSSHRHEATQELPRFGSTSISQGRNATSGEPKKVTLKVRAANSLCAEILQLSRSTKLRSKKERLWALLRLASRPDIVKFSDAQLFYLHRRAKLVGNLPSEFTDNAVHLQYVLDAQTQFYIDNYIRKNKAHLGGIDLILHCSTPLLSWQELLGLP